VEQFVRLLHSLPVLRLSLSYNFVSVGVGGTVVVRQTCDQEVVGLSLSRAHSRLVSYTYVPLSPSSRGWYWPKGDDTQWLGRPGGK